MRLNRLDELLALLQEEAAEVTQCASKCVRFGLDTVYQDKSNRVRLEEELGDFFAIIKLISEETHLDDDHIFDCAEAKLIKVESYMKNGKIAKPIRIKAKTATRKPTKSGGKKPRRSK